MAIKIVTDSACDLPQSVIEALNIEVIPLVVYVDGKEYLDAQTLSSDDLYQKMISGQTVKTAQVPVHTFQERFESYAKTKDSYIYLAFSSNLSGTYQSAKLAYEMVKEKSPNLDLEIYDTKCACLGLGVIVEDVARRVKNGADQSEVLKRIEIMASSMYHVFSVDDLEYLFRGGRVSRTQATIGNILNIKPILEVKNGFLVPIDKAKGKKKVLSKLFEYVQKNGGNLSGQTIGIAHSLNLEAALKVKEYLESEYNTHQFIMNQLGCTIGAHCGPGMIGIFFMDEASI